MWSCVPHLNDGRLRVGHFLHISVVVNFKLGFMFVLFVTTCSARLEFKCCSFCVTDQLLVLLEQNIQMLDNLYNNY